MYRTYTHYTPIVLHVEGCTSVYIVVDWNEIISRFNEERREKIKEIQRVKLKKKKEADKDTIKAMTKEKTNK